MQRITLVFILLFSFNVHAEEDCGLSSLIGEQDIINAQNCLKSYLEFLNKAINAHEPIAIEIKTKLLNLFQEKALCERYAVYAEKATANMKKYYIQNAVDCNKLYSQRLEAYKQIANHFEQSEAELQELQHIRQGLADKFDMLKRNTEVLIKK